MLSEGEHAIFAVAQDSFGSGFNSFSTLRPLATIQGDPLSPDEFRNRGLVWWMVRGDRDLTRSKPGRLLTASVEPAAQVPDSSDPDKDLYQVDVHSVQVPGTRRLMEVLTVDDASVAEPGDILNRATVRVDHEPTVLVLIRVMGKIIGPFRTVSEEDPNGHGWRVRFAKSTGDRPIYEIESRLLNGEDGHFRLQAEVALDGQPPTGARKSKQLLTCRYEILTWERFDELAGNARVVRLLSDEEILSRLAKATLTKSRRQEFLAQYKGLLPALEVVGSLGFDPAEAELATRLCARMQAGAEGVDSLVESIVASGALQTRLDAAVQTAVVSAVAEQETLIKAEAESRVRDLRGLLETTRQELDSAQADLERHRRQAFADLQSELQAQRAQAEADIAQRAHSLAHREAEVARQQSLLESRLENLVGQFKEGRDRLITDFLAIQPILESAGLLGVRNAPEARPSTPQLEQPRAEPLCLPAVLTSEAGKRELLSEGDFFRRLQRHAAECGFRYDPIDLAAFHISLKCSDLTIIGGVSGTGKSSLPRLYAQALAGSSAGQSARFLAVDVSPAWTNPADLLGYVNPLDRRFQPSVSGLFTHLAWAALEHEAKGADGGLYLVCLDEMNLAQVEHYFSGPLQALSRAPGQRDLAVFDAHALERSDPLYRWSRISLADNIRFVGTVNIDETTKTLSQRVLDRADLLRLDASERLDTGSRASTSAMPIAGESVTMKDMRSWVRDRPLETAVASLLNDLQEPLRTLGCPLTPRRQGAIARFLGSAPVELCPQSVALDLQIAQRILPQIRSLFRPEARRALAKMATLLERPQYACERSLRLIGELQDAESVHNNFEIDGD